MEIMIEEDRNDDIKKNRRAIATKDVGIALKVVGEKASYNGDYTP
jgi:hypothetical protein